MPKFTWRIENFSDLDEKKFLYSITFIINDHKWRLGDFPKANETDPLHVFLIVAEASSLPNNWSITVKYSIALINQIDSKKTIKKGGQTYTTFNYRSGSRGYPSTLPLSKFHDKVEGYLVNDTCLVEAEVYVKDAVPSPSTDKDLDSSVACDHMESVYVEVQSFLKSLPKKPSISLSNATCEMPLFKGDSTFAKEIIAKLISYPLDDLADPKHESAMMQSLTILTDNLYLFSDGQAEQLINLKATFPHIMQEWRDSVRVKGGTEHPWSTFEKTKSLLEHFVKTEDGIKTKLDELNKKDKDLEAELVILKSNTQQLKEERVEVSKQVNILSTLAKKHAFKIEEQEMEVDHAKKKLEQSLKSKWAATRHLFA